MCVQLESQHFNQPITVLPPKLRIILGYEKILSEYFLHPDLYIKIKYEFRLIRDNYLLYKKIVYQVLNILIIEIGFKKIVLNTNEFLNLNSEFKKIILSKGMQYVNNSNFQIRSKKIENLLKKIYEFKNISLNSSKTSINRIDKKIIISKN